MKSTLFGLMVSAALVACGGGGGGNESGNGSLSLGVTDAPVDHADAVVVSFIGVELLDAQGGVSRSFTLNPPRRVDLLGLQGDNQFFLIDDEPLPVGVYEEVRLLVDTENASCNNLVAPFDSFIRIDGTDYPLIVPSGGSSGFKVRGPITIAAGNSAAYTVDFDLRRAIAERGSTGCYNLKPVLRVVDNAQVGTLIGTIDGALLADDDCSANPVTGEGAAIYVYAGAAVEPDDVDDDGVQPLTSALLVPRTDGSGDFNYEVGFLLAGPYTVALSCGAGDDDPDEDDDDDIEFIGASTVAIQRDTVTRRDFLVLPAP